MNNKTTIVKLELNKVETRPTYGGSKTIVEYSLETVCNGIKNHYTIVGEIKGIATADLYLNLLSVDALNNNEETLTYEGVETLLNW